MRSRLSVPPAFLRPLERADGRAHPEESPRHHQEGDTVWSHGFVLFCVCYVDPCLYDISVTFSVPWCGVCPGVALDSGGLSVHPCGVELSEKLPADPGPASRAPPVFPSSSRDTEDATPGIPARLESLPLHPAPGPAGSTGARHSAFLCLLHPRTQRPRPSKVLRSGEHSLAWSRCF